MDSPLRRQGVRWYLRIPGKLLVFLIVTTLVEFPNPALLVRDIDHLRNMNAMVDPSAPELATFESELRDRLGVPASGDVTALGPRTAYCGHGAWRLVAPPTRKQIQLAAQQLVYEKVHYDWDWNIWGVADYMPTVSEMFAKAKEYPDGQIREDCDGRAVMAASLLKRMGFDARIVTDLRHTWVQVIERDRPPTELMGPGRAKTIVGTVQGNKFDWTTLSNLPVSLSFGIAVFPWAREAIIFVTLVVLLWHRRAPWKATLAGIVLALAGWQLLRMGVVSVGVAGQSGYAWAESPVNAWLGLIYVLAGCGVMLVASRRARRLPSRGAAEIS